MKRTLHVHVHDYRALDARMGAAEYQRQLQAQRELEGLRPAARDEGTGKVWTGLDHADAISRAIREIEKSGRHSSNLESGFLTRSGEFLTRTQAGMRLFVKSTENLYEQGARQFLRDSVQHGVHGTMILKNPSYAEAVGFAQRDPSHMLRGIRVGHDRFWARASEAIHVYIGREVGATEADIDAVFAVALPDENARGYFR